MANELLLDTSLLNRAVYAHLQRLADGRWWNGASWEAKLNAHWASYVIAMTEEDVGNGGTGSYRGSMPAVAAGNYLATYYLQAGDSPDRADGRCGSQGFYWTGSADIPLGVVLPATASPGQAGGLPTADGANGVKLSVGIGPGQVNLQGGKVPVTLDADDVSGVLSVAIAADGLDGVEIEENINVRQALSLMTAVLAGNLAGAATTTIVISAAGSPDIVRVTAGVDADGNRLAVAISPPA